MKEWRKIAVLGLIAAGAFLPVMPCAPAPVASAAAHSEIGDAEMLRGRALKPGDTIGLLAPAFTGDMKDMKASMEMLKSMGYKVKLAPSCNADYGYLAGKDDLRAKDINKFFKDDEVDAILCVRGGYGSSRLLDKLDYEAIKKHPKQLIGYSDVTALHVALLEKCRLSTVHAPMLRSFTNEKKYTPYTKETFSKGLQGKLYPGEIPMPAGKKLETIKPGRAEGIITGGNLSVLVSLVGTPYELKGDGAILFIEDVGEDTYRVDRMLRQLLQSGLLSRVNGVIVGDFVDAEKNYDDRDFHLDEVLEQYAKLSGKPWLKGVPAGHEVDNLCIPFGIKATMEAKRNGTASLTIDESPLLAP